MTCVMIVDTLYCAHRHRATLETQTARETETVYCTGTFFRRTGTGSTLRRWRAGNQSARSRRRRRRPRPSERDTGLSIRCRIARMTGIFSALVVLKQDTLAISLSHRCLPASLRMASREDARHSAATSARSSGYPTRHQPARVSWSLARRSGVVWHFALEPESRRSAVRCRSWFAVGAQHFEDPEDASRVFLFA